MTSIQLLEDTKSSGRPIICLLLTGSKIRKYFQVSNFFQDGWQDQGIRLLNKGEGNLLCKVQILAVKDEEALGCQNAIAKDILGSEGIWAPTQIIMIMHTSDSYMPFSFNGYPASLFAHIQGTLWHLQKQLSGDDFASWQAWYFLPIEKCLRPSRKIFTLDINLGIKFNLFINAWLQLDLNWTRMNPFLNFGTQWLQRADGNKLLTRAKLDIIDGHLSSFSFTRKKDLSVQKSLWARVRIFKLSRPFVCLQTMTHQL